MMAAVLYGKENLQVEPVAVPTIESGDILVRVKVALTCGTDVKVFRRGYHARMIVPPAVFGHELAGDVVAVGSDVTRFSLGQRVVAANSAPLNPLFLGGPARHLVLLVPLPVHRPSSAFPPDSFPNSGPRDPALQIIIPCGRTIEMIVETGLSGHCPLPTLHGLLSTLKRPPLFFLCFSHKTLKINMLDSIFSEYKANKCRSSPTSKLLIINKLHEIA